MFSITFVANIVIVGIQIKDNIDTITEEFVLWTMFHYLLLFRRTSTVFHT